MTATQSASSGRARRLIDLRKVDDRTVEGWLEDDCHHFGVTITHDRTRVIEVVMAAPRYPYTTCPGAAAPLRALIGAPLLGRSTDIGEWIDMRLQCTHVFDLAGLALAHAARGGDHRRYEAVVEDRPIESVSGGRPVFGAGWARLFQDGQRVLQWKIDGQIIVEPPAWAAQTLAAGFRRRIEALPPEPAEQASVLRRAILVSAGRSSPGGQAPLPHEHSLGAVCHTFRPLQRDLAEVIANSRRDWSASAEGMLEALTAPPNPKSTS